MTTVGDLLGLQGLDMVALSSSIFWAVAIICATSIIVGWFAVSGSEYMGTLLGRCGPTRCRRPLPFKKTQTSV